MPSLFSLNLLLIFNETFIWYQVANWFINARVRLWKPMVEEIYKEEFGDSEMNCNFSSENTLQGKRDYGQEINNKLEEESQDNVQIITSDHSVQASSTREHVEKNVIDCGNGKLHGNQRLSIKNGFYSQIDSDSATYDLTELGNFTTVDGGGGHNNVSLALELRNCESDGLATSDDAIHKRHNNNNNQTLVSSSQSTDLLDYHFTDSGKQQHMFGNTHLLHEFVV